MFQFSNNEWALILGGSSGFGLATAKKLSALGMNICVVHRDRKGAMTRINEQFEEIRKTGVEFLSFNADALNLESQDAIIKDLTSVLSGENGSPNSSHKGSIKVLLHSIAFGNLKPIAPIQNPSPKRIQSVEALAAKLQVPIDKLEASIESVFAEGASELYSLVSPHYGEALIEDEDVARTIYSMGTSLLTWTQKLFEQKLFAKDARVLGMTSEGNEIAWQGYAAVSAAKVALESISRSIASEFAPYGIRSNIIQAGVTDTPALQAIPGSTRMKANAKLRNPFKRLTTPEDVANVVALLSTAEASWINGTIIRVDGGEHISAF